MEDLTVKAFYSMVDDILKENHDEVIKGIFANTNESMKTEEITGYMVFNCLSLSIKISVQVILELLQSKGIFEIDEHEIAKLYLKHLSFEKEE